MSEKRVVNPSRQTSVDRDLQGSKPCTPTEDAILLGICFGVFALLIAAIWLIVHYGSQIDTWGH